jgi:hypothetical protein
MDFKTGIQFLWGAAFIVIVFPFISSPYSTQLHIQMVPGSLSLVLQYSRMNQTFSYCLGPECVGKFTPMLSLCYCAVLIHRDNFIFHCYRTVLCSILKPWEKFLKVMRKNDTQNFPCTALHCFQVSSGQCQATRSHLSLAKLVVIRE